MKDTIYREDAIKAMRDTLVAIEIPYAVNALLKIPSADRPQGEWIEMYRNGFGNIICMCSKCSFHASRSRYCPNCGARMKGVDDEEISER